jgi:hypothetical protein
MIMGVCFGIKSLLDSKLASAAGRSARSERWKSITFSRLQHHHQPCCDLGEVANDENPGEKNAGYRIRNHAITQCNFIDNFYFS